ncbi:MAG: agmatine deiminase family protein [Bryobacterales bacterium]|nr:agmatine deiminase family protein [Bryobacterales bacterium]
MSAHTPAPPTAPFRMPAEWEPHEATWLAWPHERSDWPGKFAPVPWVYAEFIRYVSLHERVRILILDATERKTIERILRKAGVNLNAIDFYLRPTDRSWTRDFCPIFVHDSTGRTVATDWIFNGWAKYPNHKRDNAIPKFVASRLKMERLEPGLVLEGGSIDVNGAGLLLTTEECLLSDVQARNPGRTREQIEAAFARYFGIRQTLWLHRGIAGDDTHGHVDDLARFTDERTIVTVIEPNKADDNHEPLRENLKLLRAMRTLDGQPFRIATLPMPAPVYFDGQRLPASYANFYIANRHVLVPVFNDPNDRIALNTLARLFPTRTIVPIYCGDLVLGLGTLHCMTQQQPLSLA